MQKSYPDRILKKLANLQFAIILLFIIGTVISIGTVIEQNESLTFYQKNYPENAPILGFIDWKFILFFSFDHVYTSYYFIILLIVFGSSLAACTLTVQFPVLKNLRNWKFYTEKKKIVGTEQILSKNSTNSVTYYLHSFNYNIFRQGKKSYAYSGLIGRVGPIVVHASILLLLVGSTLGNFGGYMIQEFVPRGEIFHMQNIVKSSSLSTLPQSLSWRLNDFWITYTESKSINQFYSDISVLDNFGSELQRKTIFVNEPFLYKGITLYQTDWNLIGLKIQIANKTPQQLALKKINKSGQNFWFCSINLKQKFSLLCKDLSGSLYIYDEAGNFVGEYQIGQPISLPGQLSFKVFDVLTSTGLQIKADPGIRTIYTAFFFLIISTYASFISYSQIWSIENNTSIVLKGKSNRATVFFQAQFRKLIKLTSSYIKN